jgi:hypothetical protein
VECLSAKVFEMSVRVTKSLKMSAAKKGFAFRSSIAIQQKAEAA